MNTEMMKGSIDILLLSLIAKSDMYGYQITKSLKELSNDVYHMSEGTLYSALKRLEKKELVLSYWSETVNGRRKYYQMTNKGKAELEKKLTDWKSITQLIEKCAEGST